MLQWRGCRGQTRLCGTERWQEVSSCGAQQLCRQVLLGSQCTFLLLAAKQPELLHCAQPLSDHLEWRVEGH